ncbi:unnamed protein product [Paramecium sonneborni]|uniref:Myb-like domain-containing protein n=1 Tax=Paramecium sonneborni TaxID=65129 RepID=A0A8S1KWU0_9CILI|nr:unnamed protein product [Paramecium sonneborni]
MKLDCRHSEIFSQQTQTKTRESPENKIKKTGHWSEQEHQLYIDFLYQSQNLAESSKKNKGQKLFKKMSETIITRSPSQCRSHHQKFNPFSGQGRQTMVLRRTDQSHSNYYLQMRSKQYIRQLFHKLRIKKSESTSEQEICQFIQ